MHVQHSAHNKNYMDSSCSWKTSYWVSNRWVGKVSFVLFFDVPHQKSWKEMHAITPFTQSSNIYKVQGSVQDSEQNRSLALGAYG